MIAIRDVQPEKLDRTPPDDPVAQRSRRDLRRINGLMRNAATLAKLLRADGVSRVLEIGCGDGGTMLDVAKRIAPRNPDVRLTLLDRQPLVGPPRQAGFEALGWRCEPVAADVFAYLGRPDAERFDAVVANLFLHHFENDDLAELLRRVSERTTLFVACEPERSPLGLLGCRLMPLIGCNELTRYDAKVSVVAGFRGRELSDLWPAESGWRLQERPVFPFSHAFRAERTL